MNPLTFSPLPGEEVGRRRGGTENGLDNDLIQDLECQQLTRIESVPGRQNVPAESLSRISGYRRLDKHTTEQIR